MVLNYKLYIKSVDKVTQILSNADLFHERIHYDICIHFFMLV